MNGSRLDVDWNAAEDFASLLDSSKKWFSPKEVGEIIGKSAEYVRCAFDNQKILGYVFNGRAAKNKEKRKSYMISREGVLLFLMESANFEPNDVIERLQEMLNNRSTYYLMKIQKRIDDILRKR